MGFSSNFKDAFNIRVGERTSEFDTGDMYHFVKTAVQNKFEAPSSGVPPTKREKFVIINSVPKQLKDQFSPSDVVIKQFLVYQVLKHYYKQPPGQQNTRLNNAYHVLENTMKSEITNLVTPPAPPAVFTLFKEERIRNAVQRLVGLNPQTVQFAMQGFLDDIKKTVFN